jgi:hypothetical protein
MMTVTTMTTSLISTLNGKFMRQTQLGQYITTQSTGVTTEQFKTRLDSVPLLKTKANAEVAILSQQVQLQRLHLH